MELVIGGKAQGKTACVLQKYPNCVQIDAGDFDSPDALAGQAQREAEDKILPVRTVVIGHLHLFVRNALKKGHESGKICSALVDLSSKLPSVVFVSDEIGCGIVPLSPSERAWRETTGRILTQLAGHAQTVTRVLFGIPQILKEEKYVLTVFMLRHGKTRGNERGSYIGVTDLPLSESGRAELARTKEKLQRELSEKPFLLAASPMKRCLETAQILFPGKEAQIVPQLSEMNFGEFEGKNYLDLSGDARYQAWIDSGGTTAFPGGEGPSSFKRRTMKSMHGLLLEAAGIGVRTVVITAHGGTVMSGMSMVTGGRYFDYKVDCGNGYICKLIYENGVFRAASSERLF